MAHDRGAMVPISPAVKLLEISTSSASAIAPFTVPTTLPTLRALPEGLAVTQTLVLSDMGMAMGSGMGGGANGRFTINGKVFDPARDDITMKAGVAQEWLVRNDGMMDHPLHIHGTSSSWSLQTEPILHLIRDSTPSWTS